MQEAAAEQNPDSLIEQGSELLKQGKNENALAIFSRAVEVASDRADSWGFRGVALCRLNRHSEALDDFRKSLALDNSDAGVWYFLGESMFALNKWQEAADAYSKSIEIDGSDGEVWSSYSACFVMLGDNDAALEKADNGLARLPGDPKVLRARSTALKGRTKNLIEEGHFEEAIKTADDALTCAGEDQRGSLMFFRAMALNGLEKYLDALASIEEADKLGAPQRGTALYCHHHAIALNGIGRFSEALGLVEAFDSKAEPDVSRACLSLDHGVSLNGLDRYEEAGVVLFGQAIEALPDPLRAALSLGRGLALVGLKRNADALPEIQQGLNAGPPQSIECFLQFLAGSVLNSLERHQEALNHLERVRELAPSLPANSGFFLQYGAALCGVGRYSDALEPLQGALRAEESLGRGSDRSAGGVYLMLAAAWNRLDRPAESLAAVEHALAILPASELPSMWLHKAQVLQRLGRPQEALEAYEEAVRADPGLNDDINIWASRAGLQLKLHIEIPQPPPSLEGHPLTLAIRGAARLMSEDIGEGWALLLRSAEEVTEKLHGDPLAWLGAGMARVMTTRHVDEALICFRKADEIAPEIARRPEFAFWRALAHEGSGQGAAAMDALKDVPENEFTRFLKAKVLADRGKPEDALAILGEARSGLALYFRSAVLMRIGRAEEAMEGLNEILAAKQNPLLRLLMLTLKALVLGLKQKKSLDTEQQALLDEASSLADGLPVGLPGKGLPSYAKGLLFSMAGQHPKAVQAYGRAEIAEPSRAIFPTEMGQSFLALEDYEEALKCFQRAMHLPADVYGVHFEALAGQGTALLRRREYGLAEDAFRRALDQEGQTGGGAHVWSGLAEAYAWLGRFQAAKDNFEHAIAASSSPALMSEHAAWVFLRLNRDEDALVFLERGTTAEAHFNRGIALYRLKRVQEARAAWLAARQAGSERAGYCLQDLERRARGGHVLFDYWFGHDQTPARKAGGALLFLALLAASALPILKLAGIPWIQAAPWTVISLPALTMLILLFLPVVSSFKVAGVEFKPAPIEPAVPLPPLLIEDVIQQWLSLGSLMANPLVTPTPVFDSTAALAKPQFPPVVVAPTVSTRLN